MVSFIRKFSCIVLLLFLSMASSIAQTGTITIKKPAPPPKKDVRDTSRKERPLYYQLYFGYKTYLKAITNNINTFDNFRADHPLQVVGIGFSEQLTFSAGNTGGNFHGIFSYQYIIPQPVWINDSINGRITGFVFGAGGGKLFTQRSGTFSFLLYGGFNTGRLRLYNNETIRQKNPFFSPKIGIRPKLNIGRVSFSILAEAEYDISKTSWRRLNIANPDKVNIDKLRQSGLTTLIGISYRLDRVMVGTVSGK